MNAQNVKIFSLQEILEILKNAEFDVSLCKEEDIKVNHLRHFNEIDESCLTFFTEKDAQILNSSCKYVLICHERTKNIPSSAICIFSEKPKAAFYLVAQHFKEIKKKTGIHPTSIVSPDSIIDATAYIGPFCYLEKCEIKSNVVLHSNISIYENTTIGKMTIVNSNTTIGVDGVMWAWAKDNEKTYMPSFRNTNIGDRCIIGANVTVAKGSLDDTVISNDCNIGHGSKIGHDCKIGEQTHLANGISMAGSVQVGKRCFVGSGASFKPTVKIADDIVVGIGSVVVKSCDLPRSVLFGNPAKKLKWLNSYSDLKGLPKRK
jgi:UDP-3-O-[3-hydroxymyristoyl] glucosamine N-acyltransferase